MISQDSTTDDSDRKDRGLHLFDSNGFSMTASAVGDSSRHAERHAVMNAGYRGSKLRSGILPD